MLIILAIFNFMGYVRSEVGVWPPWKEIGYFKGFFVLFLELKPKKTIT